MDRHGEPRVGRARLVHGRGGEVQPAERAELVVCLRLHGADQADATVVLGGPGPGHREPGQGGALGVDQVEVSDRGRDLRSRRRDRQCHRGRALVGRDEAVERGREATQHQQVQVVELTGRGRPLRDTHTRGIVRGRHA